MKKVFFSLVATLAFGLFANANTIDVETVKSKTVSVELLGADNTAVVTSDVIVVNTENTTTVESTAAAGSIKCWAFGKWLRNKLQAISDNQALIDATVAEMVKLCNVADDLGCI